MIISMIKSDDFKVISPSTSYALPNISKSVLVRKSEEQLIYMMVTNTKNSSKFVTAFSVEVDNYAQLVIPGCNYLI